MNFNPKSIFQLDNNTNENKSTNVERDEVDQSKSWLKKKRRHFDKFVFSKLANIL